LAGFDWHNFQHRYKRTDSGEQDERGDVTLPTSVATGFDSGYLLGEIIRRLATQGGKKIPSALANVKPDTSKNARLTNWNFIWYFMDDLGSHSKASD
jgi:hypothetical protein